MQSTHSVKMIDLVFLAYNKFDETIKRCLDSLKDNELHGFSVSIVDNGSTDGTSRDLDAYTITRNLSTPFHIKENCGYACGMNKGASLGNGEWIVLISSDIIFFPNSLKRMKSFLASTESDIVGFATNNAGTGQKIINTLDPLDATEIADQIHSAPTNLEIPIYRADFFCVAIKRYCWEKLNGLDTKFGKGYYEDFDFSMRARYSDFKICMTDDVFIGHQGSATLKEDPEQSNLIKKNKAIFLDRHPTAKLLSDRQENLDILSFYSDRLLATNSNAIAHRINLRLAYAYDNMPKSFFKRIIYQAKIKALMKKLDT